MEDLYYHLKYVKTPEGNYTIFISHPNGTPASSFFEDQKQKIIERRAKTTKFAQWFRKQYPQIITEFRGLHSNIWYDNYRHFVAYDISPEDFVFIKLAMPTDSIREIGIGYDEDAGRTSLGWDFVYEYNLRPSDAYLKRQAKRTRGEASCQANITKE